MQHSGREHRNKIESICVYMSSMDKLGYTALRCEELALFRPNGDDNVVSYGRHGFQSHVTPMLVKSRAGCILVTAPTKYDMHLCEFPCWTLCNSVLSQNKFTIGKPQGFNLEDWQVGSSLDDHKDF